jgi:hypothetical protein
MTYPPSPYPPYHRAVNEPPYRLTGASAYTNGVVVNGEKNDDFRVDNDLLIVDVQSDDESRVVTEVTSDKPPPGPVIITVVPPDEPPAPSSPCSAGAANTFATGGNVKPITMTDPPQEVKNGVEVDVSAAFPNLSSFGYSKVSLVFEFVAAPLPSRFYFRGFKLVRNGTRVPSSIAVHGLSTINPVGFVHQTIVNVLGEIGGTLVPFCIYIGNSVPTQPVIYTVDFGVAIVRCDGTLLFSVTTNIPVDKMTVFKWMFGVGASGVWGRSLVELDARIASVGDGMNLAEVDMSDAPGDIYVRFSAIPPNPIGGGLNGLNVTLYIESSVTSPRTTTKLNMVQF